ncbi:hypothetical protein [Candidatus Palauibacter sp.]|uniref:hypothetical protein n=1 Tax=Candidatus Palauibacter sp. TaxID=3101350 RepID=UPI003B5B477E
MNSPNETVMQFIERELKKNPGVNNATLFEGAKEIDGAIANLDARQFHAKYPLQVKRRLGSASTAVRKPAPRPKAAPAAASGSGSSEDVLAFVKRTLGENPDVKNAVLFAGACEIDASVAQLSPRQFHAKYPLQVKRRMAMAAADQTPVKPAAPKRARKPKAAPAAEAAAPVEAPSMGDGDAAGVRGLLMDFARDLAHAGTQAETIEVLARLDAYVDDIMKAARN